ncbi:S1 family peptidase [Variovorax sp. HJSM1_2]|uniref:S1 family peptidase n=1 Tax=Variovorax sp. HJSM1_2 TaxID=3366263 RepID=UPI003BD5AD74
MLLVAPEARADLVGVIEKVKPSVVIVGYYKATDNPRFTLRGTGFVVGERNRVITNAHVLVPAGEENGRDLVVNVRTSKEGWETRRATVLEVDPTHDVAALQVEGPPIPGLRVRDSDRVKEGESMAFMGFPIGGALGFSPVTHRAMISSITTISLPAPTGRQLSERVIRSLRDGNFSIFQLDGTAYPGNSGGPLFDVETGEVVGVINMTFVKGTRESALTNPSGISYAIPSKFFVELLARQKPR